MINDEHYNRRLKVVSSTSASQVAAFSRCQRLWFYDSVMGLRAPAGAAQLRGTAIHSAMEHYEKTGEVREDQWGPIVLEGIDHLPDPSPIRAQKGLSELHVEHKFVLPTYQGGPDWIGFIDLLYLDGDIAHVVDHKTSSDFKYAKTPDELSDDTQMVSYARWTYEKFSPQLVTVSHLYLRTRGAPQAKRVQAQVSRGDIAERWAKRLPVVQSMVAAASTVTDPLSLPPNKDACSMFGGCPHRSRCGFSILDSIKGASNMEGKAPLLERLKKAKDTTVSAPPADFVLPVGVVPPDAPPRESTKDEIIALAEEKAPKKRGRKAKEDKPHLVQLAEKGFTTDELVTLIAEDTVDEAIAGTITPGMMRQPKPALADKTKELKKAMDAPDAPKHVVKFSVLYSDGSISEFVPA